MFAAVQNFALVSVPGAVRCGSRRCSAMFLIAAVICFHQPRKHLRGAKGHTSASSSARWPVDGPSVPGCWATNTSGGSRISGILMTILAFWTGGQFFIEKAYSARVRRHLALMASINDIVRAFIMLRAHQEL